MMIHRHPSFFPAVLAVLTVSLGAFMFFVVRHSVSPDAPAPTPVVSQEGYRSALRAALAPVITPAGGNRASVVAQALSTLLALHVPATDLEAHLSFARALSRLNDGLKGDAAALKDGQAQFDAAVAANPWVR